MHRDSSLCGCATVCRNPLCGVVTSLADLNYYSNRITEACAHQAAMDTIPNTGGTGRDQFHAGWTDFVEPARQRPIFWHKIWIDSDCPRTGSVADIMRRTRASYTNMLCNTLRDVIMTSLSNVLLKQFSTIIIVSCGRKRGDSSQLALLHQ